MKKGGVAMQNCAEWGVNQSEWCSNCKRNLKVGLITDAGFEGRQKFTLGQMQRLPTGALGAAIAEGSKRDFQVPAVHREKARAKDYSVAGDQADSKYADFLVHFPCHLCKTIVHLDDLCADKDWNYLCRECFSDTVCTISCARHYK